MPKHLENVRLRFKLFSSCCECLMGLIGKEQVSLHAEETDNAIKAQVRLFNEFKEKVDKFLSVDRKKSGISSDKGELNVGLRCDECETHALKKRVLL